LRSPTILITGDRDTMVSPKVNACALAAALPRAKLVLLKGVGHMSHHAVPEAVAAAIDELAAPPRAIWLSGPEAKLAGLGSETRISVLGQNTTARLP
jgi:hypothetical protein